jgi:hypothetical protein
MPLDQAGRQTVQNWLTTKCPNLACPCCGSKTLSVEDVVVAHPLHGTHVVGGRGMPMVAVLCSACANALLFSAIAIGILPRTAPPSGAGGLGAGTPAPAPADVGRPAPTTQSHTTPPGPTPVDSSPSARSPGTPNRSVPPRQAPLTQPAPRGHVPADTAPAPSPEPTPAGAAWLSTILAGILFLLGAALALYTLARPFLPAH